MHLGRHVIRVAVDFVNQILCLNCSCLLYLVETGSLALLVKQLIDIALGQFCKGTFTP